MLNIICHSVQFSSVAQSCSTLCYPMNRSTPGLPVHHLLLEFIHIHVHRVSDAIQSSLPLLPLLLLPSIFPITRGFSSESVLPIRWSKYWNLSSASVLPMNIQDWFPLGLSGLTSLHSKGLSRVFSSTKNLQMYKLDLEKAEEPEIKLSTFIGS